VHESLLAFLGYGVLLGMRHATDADHVVAVATIVSRRPEVRAAALMGAAWGAGHTLTLLLAGGMVAILGVAIPAGLAMLLELSVASMLVTLGIISLAGGPPGWARSLTTRLPHMAALRYVPAGSLHRHMATPPHRAHAHMHVHGDYVHSHTHGHGATAHGHAEGDTPPARLDRWLGRWRAYRLARPFVVGSVHGLAGSAVVGLMVAATLDGPLAIFAYLAAFGTGTVAGMMLVTATLALPFTSGAGRLPHVHAALRMACALASVAFGVWLAWQAVAEFGPR
jgi:high-affinity nickel-transport protein